MLQWLKLFLKFSFSLVVLNQQLSYLRLCLVYFSCETISSAVHLLVKSRNYVNITVINLHSIVISPCEMDLGCEINT